MNLLEYIENYNNSEVIPFHMPGHKRNVKFAKYLEKLYACCDITEIYGMDDLHSADGILKECMEKTKNLWGSQRSYFIVNGSTAGILSGIRACTSYGDEILVARNCHKSVYNAVELFGLKPTYILPEYIDNFSIYGSVNPKDIENILNHNRKIKLVILTSPTYEGVISNIKEISEIAHRFGIPVMVDEAHGSHLDLSSYFTGGSVKSCADIVVQSLHKTLPSLTQTAVIHLNSDIINPKNLQRQLSIFQTSSPSYILMSSIDCCIELIQDKNLFKIWNDNLKFFKKKVSELQNLKILGYTDDIRKYSGIYNFDFSKIIISTANTNITGNMLMETLRDNYKIELEMCNTDYVVAMTSMTDTVENISILADALVKTDNNINKLKRKATSTFITKLPKKKLSISLALNCQKKQKISYTDSVGKISSEYIWIYPPGIPIITPGEIINSEITQIINTALNKNMNLQKTSSENPTDIEIIYNT